MSTPTETVERLYASFAAGDLDRVLELLDPDVEWITPPTLPWSRGTYHGSDEVVSYFESFGAALERPAVVPERILAAATPSSASAASPDRPGRRARRSPCRSRTC